MSPIGSRVSYVKIVCPCTVHSIRRSILGKSAQGARWITRHRLLARQGPFNAVRGEGLSFASSFRRSYRLPPLLLVLLVSIVVIRGIVITTASTFAAEQLLLLPVEEVLFPQSALLWKALGKP